MITIVMGRHHRRYDMYESYRTSYNPAPERTLRAYYHCHKCKENWYSKDGYGFITCPRCRTQSKITSHIDVTQGALGLARYTEGDTK